MLLNEREVDVTNLVVERFLNLGEATPRRGLLLKARSRDMLDKLSRWSILKLYDNKDFLPLPLAFHFCGNTEALLLAKRSITLLGHVLRNLFENDLNEGAQHTSAEAEDHTRKMYGRVNSKEIQLGFYLGQDFNFFMTWYGNQTHTQITSFAISETIIEINPDALWDDYIKRQTQWIEGQLGQAPNPFLDTRDKVEIAPAEAASHNGPGRYAGWEIIRPLSKSTGQGEVFLVRNPQRVAELTEASKAIQRYAGGISLDQAPTFAKAIWQSARADLTSELGALKVFKLRGDGAKAEQEVLERLSSEIHVLSKNKPGLLRLLAFNEKERWIITEYQPNGTLENHPFRFKGDAARALRALRPLVLAVADLHTEGIVHRDIKPPNVFLGNEDTLVLGDFGIVYLPNQPERVTRTNERVGPYDYMPLWADLGERLEKVEPNFDVYMLGKLLWCMVAGKLKLPRECFREPGFDLTQLFHDDPRMHIINSILEKCVVEKAKDCFYAATDLLQTVDAFLRVIDSGGQLLRDGIPRLCRICGTGYYQLRPVQNAARTGLRLWRGPSSNDTSMLNVRIFMCDNCKHIEFFASS